MILESCFYVLMVLLIKIRPVTRVARRDAKLPAERSSEIGRVRITGNYTSFLYASLAGFQHGKCAFKA